MNRFALCAALIMLCRPCLGGNTAVTNEVLRVVANYEKAINQPDPVLWLSIWDLQYHELTIIENDKPQTLGREYVEQIADWMKTARPEKRQTWHTNRVYMLSPDLAYVVSLRTEHHMPESQKESRVTLLVRKNETGWKIVHCHFSFVPR